MNFGDKLRMRTIWWESKCRHNNKAVLPAPDLIVHEDASHATSSCSWNASFICMLLLERVKFLTQGLVQINYYNFIDDINISKEWWQVLNQKLYICMGIWGMASALLFLSDFSVIQTDSYNKLSFPVNWLKPITSNIRQPIGERERALMV